MKKLSLEFRIQNNLRKIIGLQLINIETNNSYYNTLKSSYLIELKGIFLGSNEQLLIQDLAFNKRNFSGTIKHTNFEIEAIFDIQKYEISNDIGELDHFKLKLECKKSLKHTILSVEV